MACSMKRHLLNLGSGYDSHGMTDQPGAPNVNFREKSVRKTIWDLEFSEHLS